MKWIAVAVAVAASIAHAEPAVDVFRIELRKTDDSVTVTPGQTTAVVRIASRSGIGGAKLVRTGAKWPARLTLRLDLKGLESFAAENGIIHFNTAIKGPKTVPYWRVGRNERQAATPDGTVEVAMVQTDEYIEIVLPRELTDGNPQKIGITWIDFFR
jgi:hypothetical protein